MRSGHRSVTILGVTLRVAPASEYDEPRDAIAHDWFSFFRGALPEIRWVLLPNLGTYVVDYGRDLGVDGYLLTGGNDLGGCSVKDETDRALLVDALERGIPTFGVCRGLQLLNEALGGRIRKCSAEEHVATRHPVTVTPDAGIDLRERTWSVNSYHQWGIAREEIAPELIPCAFTDDGWVEAARHRDAPVGGVMWHPEREQSSTGLDRGFMRDLFGLDVLAAIP